MRISGDLVIAAAPDGVPVAIAALDSVAWIEPYDLRVTHNEEAGAIIGIPAAHAAGYDGSTQIVAVADTGIGDAQEDGNTTDRVYSGADPHPDIPASRVVEVLDYPGVNGSCGIGSFTVIPDGAQDVDSGHGTHVSGSVLSDGDTSGIGLGQAPAARLVLQATEDYADMSLGCELGGLPDGYYLLGLPDDLGDLLQDAYDLGARIHSDSWGSDVSGDYTVDAAQVDTFMWDNPDLLMVTSAGNAGEDGNSDGEVDEDSMGSPATAKNVLTVGASENDRSDNFPCDDTQSYVNPSTGLSCQTQTAGSGFNDIFTYGGAWPADYPANPVAADSSAGNAEQLAAFSSRGPTDDGRIKPDVVAPGTWVLSGYSSEYQEGYSGTVNPQNGAYQYDGWGFPYSTFYKYMGGTSMSAPITSGSAAVVRDFYDKADGHEASAALTKATLINSADDLLDENNDGVDDNDYPIPNNHEGWGIIDVAEATDGDHVYSDRVPVNTSETVSYDVTAPGGTELKVTVVWTDYPSTDAAAVNLVNDIDLTVTAPGGGTEYLGNVFSGGWSLAGGSADNLNNVENVYVQSAAAGTWTVEVSGTNIPQGPQPFAIVIHGAMFSDATPPVWPGGAQLSQTDATGTTVTVDWSANPATDDVGVVAYDVYVDGVLDQSVAGTEATITGLAEEGAYTVVVEARDAAGNTTGDGPSVTALTVDATAPSWPDLTISAREVFETSLELNWVAASDANGITSHTITDAGGQLAATSTLMATSSTTSILLTDLNAYTSYDLTVTAYDPSGNVMAGPNLVVMTAPDFADTNGSSWTTSPGWPRSESHWVAPRPNTVPMMSSPENRWHRCWPAPSIYRRSPRTDSTMSQGCTPPTSTQSPRPASPSDVHPTDFRTVPTTRSYGGRWPPSWPEPSVSTPAPPMPSPMTTARSTRATSTRSPLSESRWDATPASSVRWM